MNYAAVLKPKPIQVAEKTAPYLKDGWVNLRDWKPEGSKQKGGKAVEKDKDNDNNMDTRLKEAAVVLRKRWDQWNADHGIEYDYDRECSCSEGSSDEDTDEENKLNGALDEECDFDRDYQYIKKTTLVTH